MREKLGKSLNHLQTIAIQIDEVDEIVDSNSKISRAYEVLIKTIYKWHKDDATAVGKFFKEIFMNRLIDVIADVEEMLKKYKYMIEPKYHAIFRVYNALKRVMAFMEDLISVKQ